LVSPSQLARATQSTVNAKTTISLVAITAVALALILLLERPYRESLNAKPERRVFPGLNTNSIKAIQIRPKGKFDIRVEKTNAVWQIIRPSTHAADPSKLATLLNAIQKLEWQARITPEDLRDRPNPQEEFGFDPPQFSITIEQTNAVRHVLVGSNTVMGDQVFLQVVGGEGFFLLDSKFLSLFPQTVEAWRDPAILPGNILLADSIEVRSSNKVFKLEINLTNRLWRMTKPLEARADSTKINSLLTNLAATRATQFVADDPNLDFEKFGLPNTAAQLPELEITLLQNTNVLSSIQVGAADTNAPGQVFVRHSGQSAIVLAPAEVFEPWRASHVEFRHRKLVNFDKNQIHQIAFQGEDQFIVRRETNNDWRVTTQGFSADPEIINELLTALVEIQFNIENDVVTDFAPFGLVTPLLDLEVHGTLTNVINHSEDAAIEYLRFGTNETERVFFRRNEEGRVHSIHHQEFELFPRASWQLRNRQIWDFAVSNVVSVTIYQQGKSRKILRTAENEWSIAPGSQGLVNPFSIEEAVHRLGQLRAVFWTARSNEKNGRFGFAEADHRIDVEIRKNGQAETVSVELGGFSPFRQPYAAVALSGQRTIFEFPLALYLEFVRKDLSIVPPPLPSN
jgi:hypothetical protein